MKLADALEYFEGDAFALADALGIRPQNIYHWRNGPPHNGLVPIRHAVLLNKLSDDALKIQLDDYMTPVQKKLLKAKGVKR